MNIITLLFILITFLFFSLSSPAQRVEQIVCSANGEQISRQFAHHWEHSWPQWWSSWAHEYMSGKMFGGGMRTIQNKPPKDNNPHLQFTNAVVGKVDGTYVLICRYHIGNQELMDIDDVLEMRVIYPATFCKTVSNNTFNCYQ